MDELDELLLELEYDIEESLVGGKLDNEIKDVAMEESEFMYTEYTPKHKNKSRYRRRESGSYADRRNLKSEIKRIRRNTLTYTLENNRKTDCKCIYCTDKDIYLDILIEEGIAGSIKIPKRPVSERISDRLDDEKILENVLTSDLRSKGWDIK